MPLDPPRGLSFAALVLALAGCTAGGGQAPPAPMAAEESPVPAPVAEPDPARQIFRIARGDRAIGGTPTYRVRPGETLLDVARDYDLGYTQLITANRGIDPWRPPAGAAVVLPERYLLPDVPRRGIVVNLAQNRLFYFPGNGTVETYPIGVGMIGRSTPLAATRVVRKEAHPVWHVPASIRAEKPDLPAAVAAGPDNPLGDFALALGIPSYLIHGTNKPYGVGRNVSHGCIRLYPEDIETLFKEVRVGTPVRIIDREAVTAWVGDALYLAVFPDKRQAEALDLGQPPGEQPPPGLREQVAKAAAARNAAIDWAAVVAAGRQRSGIPVRISLPPTPGPVEASVEKAG